MEEKIKYTLGTIEGELRLLNVYEVVEVMMILQPYSHVLTTIGEPLPMFSALIKAIQDRIPFDFVRLLAILTGLAADDIIEENENIIPEELIIILAKGFAINQFADILFGAAALGIFNTEPEDNGS